MFWIWLIILGAIGYYLTLKYMDNLLTECIKMPTSSVCEEYKKIRFYNKILFIIGFPIIFPVNLIIMFYDREHPDNTDRDK